MVCARTGVLEHNRIYSLFADITECIGLWFHCRGNQAQSTFLVEDSDLVGESTPEP